MTTPEQLRRQWATTSNLVKPNTSWYRITNTGAVAELYIYDEIGFMGVSADRLAQELSDVNSRRIELHINSPGGSAADGVAIFNALSSHPANVTTIVDGWAASAASVIAMAGDEIYMRPGSLMMIHKASGLCLGNDEDMAKMAQTLRTVTGSIADIYTARRGGNRDDWLKAMAEETWYTPDEAVAVGLADKEMSTQDSDEVRNQQTVLASAEDPFDAASFAAALKGAWS